MVPGLLDESTDLFWLASLVKDSVTSSLTRDLVVLIVGPFACLKQY